MARHRSDQFYVGAIDLGTTFSGYACSSKADYERDPLNISAGTWISSSAVSLKTSTCILFDPSKKFHSFGFEAEDKYSDLAEDEEHYGWYFFRRFKMMLYTEKKITKTTVLRSAQGSFMPAIDVFAAAIKYLKDQMFAKCKDEVLDILVDDVQWVLTVPAIWDDTAKAFMREAALQAGIKDKKLLLALEPEAASIFCKEMPVRLNQAEGHIARFSPGSKYLILDAGGGTIDITVHEITEKSDIKEVYKANGGDWGGTKVDKAFEKLLEDLVGKRVMDAFTKQYQADMVDLFNMFEIKKRKISRTTDSDVKFKIPVSLLKTYEEFNNGEKLKRAISSNPTYKNSVKFSADKMVLTAARARELFKTSVDKIVDHVKTLINTHVSNLDCLLMVGGYSESMMLQEAIKSAFQDEMQIIIPKEAGLAIVKGAVMFGHNQFIMKTRICRYTYGISCSREFVEGEHLEEKRFKVPGQKDHCGDLFLKIIEEGTEIVVGESLPPKTLTALRADDTKWYVQVVSSRSRDVKYITEDPCKILGPIVIDMPDTSKGLDRAALYTMSFEHTELKVTAKDRDSGREVAAKFKFI